MSPLLPYASNLQILQRKVQNVKEKMQKVKSDLQKTGFDCHGVKAALEDPEMPTMEELMPIVCALLASGHYTERIETMEELEVPVLSLKGEDLACLVDAISLWKTAREHLGLTEIR